MTKLALRFGTVPLAPQVIALRPGTLFALANATVACDVEPAAA